MENFDGLMWVSALWRRGCLGKLLAVVLSVVFAVSAVVVGAVVVFALWGEGESAQGEAAHVASPTVTVSGTVVVADTETPIPTEVFTPAPVAIVEIPTATVVPTPDPTAGTPPEVVSYVSDIEGPVGEIGDAMGSLDELFQTPLLGELDWTLNVSAQLVIIRFAHEKLTKVIAPPGLVVVHTTLVAATSRCNDATYLFISGLDNRNVAEVEQAMSLIAECGAGFVLARQQLEIYATANNFPVGGQ